MTLPGPSKRFPSSFRLHRPEEFQAVLRANARRGRHGRGQWFAVAAVQNTRGHCRLGIVVARKAVPRAVSRNRHKRLIRETFRELRGSLPAMDLVVKVIKEAKDSRALAAARTELGDLMGAIAQ